MDGVVSDDEFSLNPGAGGDGEEDEAPLRAALHYSIGEICSAQEGGLPMTASAVSTLAEVCGMRISFMCGFATGQAVEVQLASCLYYKPAKQQLVRTLKNDIAVLLSVLFLRVF